MTDTLHKNPESCTVCNTPETDIEASNGSLCDQCVPAEFARKLERERDEAINACHIWQRGHSEIVKEHDGWKTTATVLEKERNKLLRRIDVLATDREDWKRLAVEQERDINEYQQELATIRKQNNERLTILQEHGLAEYGN